MPYFVITFWGKNLTKISLFKDISWNQTFERMFFFRMVFQLRNLVETIQLFFWCYHHTSEENTAFEMIFWSRKTSKKQKFGNISWYNKQIRKLDFLYNFCDAKDDGISTLDLIFCDSPQTNFRKLRNIQEIKPKNIYSVVLSTFKNV